MLLGGNECKSTSANTQTSGDVRGHVSRLKKNTLGFHLCFNLHQMCPSVAEAVSPHCKPFLLLYEDFQAVFYSQSKALIPQINSSHGHGAASAIHSFLGQTYQSGQILPEVPEKPPFCSNFQSKHEKIVWLPFLVCCLKMSCFLGWTQGLLSCIGIHNIQTCSSTSIKFGSAYGSKSFLMCLSICTVKVKVNINASLIFIPVCSWILFSGFSLLWG